MRNRIAISPTVFALAIAAVLTVVYNVPFVRFAVAEQGVAFALRCMMIIASFYGLVLVLFAWPRVQKPVVVVLLLIAAAASYFIDRYGIYIDIDMVRNIAQTDRAEAGDLMSASFAVWMFFAFVVPCLLIWRVEIVHPAFSLRKLARLAAVQVICAVVFLTSVWSGMQELAPFYRNNREIRHLITPYNAVAASIKYVREDVLPKSEGDTYIPTASYREPSAGSASRNVVVFVVGETARAANFSLGGYERDTNPRLAARGDIAYFSNFSSCGTHTAFSLPCMFSRLGREDFALDKFASTDDLISLVAGAGVKTLWIDNNSGCKGVCDGAEITDAGSLAKQYTQHCPDGECYDEVLAEQLKQALKRKGDLFIVLHQKGSHGPLYYKRMPDQFARFQPSCKNADLSKCAQGDIVNAYDNSILYTDHVLDLLIEALADEPSAALLYASDHGESLGESGMYLHGAPYMLAPSEQTHIPAMLWLSAGAGAAKGITVECLQAQGASPYSHDNLFSTLLDLNHVRSTARDDRPSLLNGCRQQRAAEN